MQTSSKQIDESTLTKGQRRKLNALRKSVGDDIGEWAFAEWLSSRPVAAKTDKNAKLIAGTLWPVVQQGRLTIVMSRIFCKKVLTMLPSVVAGMGGA